MLPPNKNIQYPYQQLIEKEKITNADQAKIQLKIIVVDLENFQGQTWMVCCYFDINPVNKYNL